MTLMRLLNALPNLKARFVHVQQDGLTKIVMNAVQLMVYLMLSIISLMHKKFRMT